MPELTKHASLEAYKKWYRSKFELNLEYEETLYKANTELLRDSFSQSPLWLRLLAEIGEISDKYLAKTRFALLDKLVKPTVEIKPFESLIDKTYRLNEIHNKKWPDEPNGGWILPENWLTRINDIVRTKLEVQYLDGVTFMVESISDLCEESNIKVKSMLEAREQGYYAAHLQCQMSAVLPGKELTPIVVPYTVEIQVTTALQFLIQQLSHKHYERNRITLSRPDVKWQWDYRSPQFSVNYLAHILHYIEGMITELRDK